MLKDAENDQVFKVNAIAILMDVVDQYLAELRPEYKHGMKRMLNQAKNHTNKFIRECDSVFTSDNQEDFGSTADSVREYVDSLRE